MIYIPIGVQCGVAQALRDLKLRQLSFPFDWVLTPAKYLPIIFKTLLESGAINANKLFYNINELVPSKSNKVEYFNKDYQGKSFTNIVTKFTFPHDFPYTIDTENKYIRRFERLLSILKSNNNEICFVYADSPNNYSHYNYDNIDLSSYPLQYLNKLSRVLDEFNINHKIVYFTYQYSEFTMNCSKNIILHTIQEQNNDTLAGFYKVGKLIEHTYLINNTFIKTNNPNNKQHYFFILNENFYDYGNVFFNKNQNELTVIDEKETEFLFKKNNKSCQPFTWFGWRLDKGIYNISFEFSANKTLNELSGIKLHYPEKLIYKFENIKPNNFITVTLENIEILTCQLILFIFDNEADPFEFKIKKFLITEL